MYYLNRIQHSKFVTPGALCHMCSPFNRLNDFVSHGPLPAASPCCDGTAGHRGESAGLSPSHPAPGSWLQDLQPPRSHTFIVHPRVGLTRSPKLPGGRLQGFCLFSVWLAAQ